MSYNPTDALQSVWYSGREHALRGLPIPPAETAFKIETGGVRVYGVFIHESVTLPLEMLEKAFRIGWTQEKQMQPETEHQCVGCRKLLPETDLVFGPCPYASEINDDDTPVWLCEECRQSRADDI